MTTLTVPALRRAIETRDGATLAAFYADDAVLRRAGRARSRGATPSLRIMTMCAGAP